MMHGKMTALRLATCRASLHLSLKKGAMQLHGVSCSFQERHNDRSKQGGEGQKEEGGSWDWGGSWQARNLVWAGAALICGSGGLATAAYCERIEDVTHTIAWCVFIDLLVPSGKPSALKDFSATDQKPFRRLRTLFT